MKQALSATYPHLRLQVEDLVEDYEQARYAPESNPLSSTQLKQCSLTLHHLVAAERADQDEE